jgi:hypothetical protein
MRPFFIFLIIFVLISTGIARSQTTPANTSDVLEALFNSLVDNYNDKDRILINDSIRTILDSYVKSDTVFNHRFPVLRYMGQITSPDSLLKIITWNLVLENEPGRYFCYFIKKEPDGKPNKTYRLSATYNGNPVRTDTTYTEQNWYGALYYDLRPVVTAGKRCWTLLGIDYGNPEISRKVIDILDFNSDDSIILGRKWFDTGEERKFRVVFEYASNAMMTLRFRSDTSVIFDHLAPLSSSHKEDSQYYGPDYSFDTYDFDGENWKLKINVDARNK